MRCSRKGRCDGRALPAEDAGTDSQNDWRRQMDDVSGHLSLQVDDGVTWLFVVLTIAAGVMVGNWFSNLFK